MLASSAAAERRVGAYAERDARAERGEVRIACANRRLLQRRRRRNVRFDAARQALFLAHFAATCDVTAAAGAAGVAVSTVHLHRRTDFAFAHACRTALAEGYALLEIEALRLARAAQARHRAAVERGLADPYGHGQSGGIAGRGGLEAATPGVSEERTCPSCGASLPPDPDDAFDRAMKLLARRDRKGRNSEGDFAPGGRRQEWTPDRALALLDRHLRALGARRTPPATG